MPITDNKFQGERARFSLNNEGKVIREYIQTRLIQADTAYSEYQIGQALPYQPGVQYSADTSATLKSMELVRRFANAPHCAWDVTLNFATDGAPQCQGTIDPTQQRVKMTFQTSAQTIYVMRDRNKDLITNKAKQPFDGGVPITLELPTYVYERNETSFSGTYARTWINAINKYSFNGCDPKTLRLKLSSQRVYEGGYSYWAIRYEMAYYPLGWQPQVLNAGLLQLVSGKLQPCLDSFGRAATSAMPLDSNGKQIAQASLPAGVNYIEVDQFNQKDFKELGLDEFS